MPPIKRYQDSFCHRLAVEIRREVLRLTRRAPVRSDFRFVSQIRDSARGAPRNIAEGHSRFKPTEILPFLSYAKASAHETDNHVVDGHQSGYFSREESDALRAKLGKLISALLNWIRYLESPAARQFYEQYRARRSGSTQHPHDAANPEVPGNAERHQSRAHRDPRKARTPRKAPDREER